MVTSRHKWIWTRCSVQVCLLRPVRESQNLMTCVGVGRASPGLWGPQAVGVLWACGGPRPVGSSGPVGVPGPGHLLSLWASPGLWGPCLWGSLCGCPLGLWGPLACGIPWAQGVGPGYMVGSSGSRGSPGRGGPLGLWGPLLWVSLPNPSGHGVPQCCEGPLGQVSSQASMVSPGLWASSGLWGSLGLIPGPWVRHSLPLWSGSTGQPPRATLVSRPRGARLPRVMRRPGAVQPGGPRGAVQT